MGEHDGHRARMKKRFVAYGLDSFDDHNVLELLLFYAMQRKDTNHLAHELLNTFGTLDRVFSASIDALKSVDGVGESTAILIRLVPAISRRCSIQEGQMDGIIRDSTSAGRYLAPYFLDCPNEAVYLLCLDAKYKVLDCCLVGGGTPDRAQISTRKIVSAALRQNASAVILAHNHPNGIAVPSAEDIQVTRSLKQMLASVGVDLLDHIVIGSDDFVSLADSRCLDRSYG